MSQPDGLADLQAKRQARRRGPMPQPRHPRQPPPERTAEPESASDPAAAHEPAAAAPEASARRTTARPARGGEQLRLGQFYLDTTADDWVREVRLAALQQRVNITASAVVRWALNRAAQQASPQQVIEELLASEPLRRGPGRPRR